MSWLDDVKAGDTVIESSRAWMVPRTITKTTKTRIHIGDTQYVRSSGRRVGAGTWDSYSLSEATPQALELARADVARRRANALARKLADHLVRCAARDRTELVSHIEPMRMLLEALPDPTTNNNQQP